jgi:O-antigen biosynthesis protein
MKTKSLNRRIGIEFSQSMFCAPVQLDKISAWFEHGPFAFWITDQLRPKQIVELGTHTGYSYFCFCQAVEKLQVKTKCVAVDTWKGDEHSYFYGEEIFDSVVRTNEKYGHFSRLLRTTFDEALAKFPPKTIDLLHIDGRHFYEDVKHDYESWLPKLTDDAIVLFHDTNVQDRDFGVWKLFKELKKKHTSFEFLHGHGLGVLAPKKVPSTVKDFFASNHSEVRAIFASLGGAISTRWALQETQAKLQKAILVGGQMEKQFQDQKIINDSLQLLQKKNSELESERDQLKSELANRNQMALSQKPIISAIAKLQADAHQSRSLAAKISSGIDAIVRPSSSKLAVLRKSIYFDADWYLSTYKDVASSGMDPAIHYIEYGAQEGRDPGPFFSTRDYQAKFPQTADGGQNPLLHSISPAWLRSRMPRPLKPIEYITYADRVAIKKHISELSHKPLISVVMPAYNTPEKLLRQAIASVQAQLYTNWELCIANDASTDPIVAKVLNEYAAKDQRIKIIHRKENGNISAATNSALELATGEFIALMDHDDLVHETALYEVAAEINTHPDVDVIYSDEDHVDGKGRHSVEHFKTDFNPELFLSQNMISHLGVYRHSLMKKIGGFREGFDGAQDYDLALRAWAASSSEKIRHIPAILYHWRQGASTRSFSESQLEKCTNSARAAIQEFLDLKIGGAKVHPVTGFENYHRVQYPLPKDLPLVSVIVPTKDKAELLSMAATGILEQTDYKNIELLVIDHESSEPATLELFEKLKCDPRVRVLPYSGTFNYSAMNNMAVNHAKGSIIALVNNDIEVIEPSWLTEMISHAVRPEVGAVGAKLYYPDYCIQHAGVIIGVGGVAGHAFHLQKKNSSGYMAHAVLCRAVSAVTGACLVVRKTTFEEVDGLEADNLPIAFNDIDFCLKVQALGYRNIWTPFAELVHHESLSRGAEDTPAKQMRFQKEAEYMIDKWEGAIANDIYYNPNLSLVTQNYEKAKPSRRKRPWVHFLG